MRECESPDQVSVRPRSWRVPILLAVLAVLVAATAQQLPKDPLLAARLAMLLDRDRPVPRSEPSWRLMEASDPAIGTGLPDTAAAKEIRRRAGRSRAGYLLVGVGDCMSCISFEFKPWRKSAGDFRVQLIAFSGGSAHAIEDLKRAVGDAIVVVRDPQNRLTNALNAYWGGRVYYFDRSWRLRWVMHGPGNRLTLDRLGDLQAEIRSVSNGR